jgi:hypothetical protein
MDSMTHPERVRLRAAAFQASRVYPGPIGELIYRELTTWEEFGYRLGGRSMIMRLVKAVERAAKPVPDAA